MDRDMIGQKPGIYVRRGVNTVNRAHTYVTNKTHYADKAKTHMHTSTATKRIVRKI